MGYRKAEVLCKALLAGEAIIVLPGVAEQHGERHLVTGAQFLRFEEKVWDLGESRLAPRFMTVSSAATGASLIDMTVIVTVARLETAVPSLAVKVKLSLPWKSVLGV